MGRGGIAFALLVAVVGALLFLSAAQSVTQQFARYRPASSDAKVGAASEWRGGSLSGRRLLGGHYEQKAHPVFSVGGSEEVAV